MRSSRSAGSSRYKFEDGWGGRFEEGRDEDTRFDHRLSNSLVGEVRREDFWWVGASLPIREIGFIELAESEKELARRSFAVNRSCLAMRWTKQKKMLHDLVGVFEAMSDEEKNGSNVSDFMPKKSTCSYPQSDQGWMMMIRRRNRFWLR